MVKKKIIFLTSKPARIAAIKSEDLLKVMDYFWMKIQISAIKLSTLLIIWNEQGMGEKAEGQLSLIFELTDDLVLPSICLCLRRLMISGK